ADSVYHKAFYGDELRINQILINLLSNAVKFTPKGGCITFVLEEIPNSGKNNKIRYKFSVKDTGIGMTEEFKQNLFEPFTRGANVSHIEGTGLGLSITKGLVDLMDGSINVTSSINKGTLFEVELEFEVTPEIDVDCTSPVINPMDDMVLNGCKFLIVEDNMINSEILCELIQMQGGDYVVKTDGMQAVEEFESNKPGTYDAILMDIQMPVMNGFEATKSIRALNREDAASIPIIAMTANAFSEDVQESLDIGMNAHVAKPVDMREFCEVIIRLVYKK
ncbi:MAG: ATP-binding protein, partial [Anaerovoracaceae bacterium]